MSDSTVRGVYHAASFSPESSAPLLAVKKTQKRTTTRKKKKKKTRKKSCGGCKGHSGFGVTCAPRIAIFSMTISQTVDDSH